MNLVERRYREERLVVLRILASAEGHLLLGRNAHHGKH